MTTQRDDVLDRVAALLEPTHDALPNFHRRMRRRHRNRKIGAYALITVITAIAVVAISQVRTGPSPSVPADPSVPPGSPSADLGIFAPVAGRYVIGSNSGIHGIAASSSTVQLTYEPGIPLGWTANGRRLLIMQFIRGDRVVTNRRAESRLIVLHADGSESVVTEQRSWIDGAAISPNGSHVAFAINGEPEVYIVDARGGRPEVLFDMDEADGGDVSYPTFSPDGARIAFVVGGGDYGHRVWVMNADGSEPHEVLANETTLAVGHVDGLAWSPTGDRISIMLREHGAYTFAPDGSGFTAAETVGWYWSPDGSRLARGPWHPTSDGPPVRSPVGS